MQKSQKEWNEQWDLVHDHIKDDYNFLLKEWIYPNTFQDFKGKEVVDCGCGSGEHLALFSKYFEKGTGIDLNPSEYLLKRFKNNKKIKIVKGDLAKVEMDKNFDIVYSIGVIHHTNNPDETFKNISKLCKNDGKVIVWVYSHEGNFLNRAVLEPIKSAILLKTSTRTKYVVAKITTILMYIPIYTIYLLPLKFFPFYEYFQNWRRLSFKMNLSNVFDKINAPTTHFITKERIEKWFSKKEFKNIHISPYKGVSWRGSATKI